jgi:hypothetical protein
MKKCIKCLVEKDESEYSRAGSYKDVIYYRGDCKQCCRDYMKLDKAQEQQIRYRKSEHGKKVRATYKQTSEKYKEGQKEYGKKRFKEDPLFACKKNLRDRLGKALKSKKWKKDTHFSEYIGCDLETLKKHLESKFTEGMTWNNRGFGKDKWTIDHIIPLSSAKTPEEMYKLSHYTNLQPMWYLDNIHKSDKY